MIHEDPWNYLQYIRHETEKEHLNKVFATKLDVFEKVGDPSVKGQVYLYDLLRHIRYNIHPSVMLTPKYIDRKKNPDYDKQKTEMEAVCFPARFNKYKNLKNLRSINNLMFAEIDFDSRNEAKAYKNRITLHYDWIVACYFSLSQQGLHILIKMDQIHDNDDYNTKYDIISKKFFQGKLDNNSKSLTRYSITPFDSDIYINDIPKALLSEELINSDNRLNQSVSLKGTSYIMQSVPQSYLTEEEGISAIGVRSNNFDSLEGYDEQGIKFSENKDIVVIEARIGYNLAPGVRQNVLSSYANNLLFLNQWMPEEQFSKFIYSANKQCFTEPLEKKEVKKIIRSKLKNLRQNKLEAIYTHRMIVFHPKCKMSREEKNHYVISVLARNKTIKSREKLYAILESWDFETYGRISVRNIAKNFPVSKKTVAKYYHEFKEYVVALNSVNA